MKYQSAHSGLIAVVLLVTPACHLIFGVGDPTLKSGTAAGGAEGGNDDGGGGSGAGDTGNAGGAGGGAGGVDPCANVECESENACTERTCNEFGDCVPEFKTGDLESSEQIAGDCKTRTCENGLLVEVANNTDAPPSPLDVCYEFVCSGGLPTDAFLTNGAGCGDLGGFCEDGLCSVCDDPTDCGDSTPCLIFDCVFGACTATPAAPTALEEQIPGDCLSFVCMGEALPVTIPFPEDEPNDTNECTTDKCADDGVQIFEPLGAGDLCEQGYCDGEGHCVECVFDVNCATDPQGAFCSPETFSCGCKAASHCATNPLGLSCIQPAGVCGCASDQHCKTPRPYCNTTTRQCQATKPVATPIDEVPMDIDNP